MASTAQFFAKLIGIHDVTVNGGSTLPRRSLINFINGLVEDVNDSTQVSIVLQPTWVDPSAIITAQQDDFLPTGFETLTDIAINPNGATRKITGFDATGLKVFTKRVWNLTTDASDLQLLSGNTASTLTNRMTTPDGLTLTITPGGVVTLVRNQTGIGWRVLP